MTVTPTKRDGQDLSSARPTTEPIAEKDQQFDWRNCWYPGLFFVDTVGDLPDDATYLIETWISVVPVLVPIELLSGRNKLWWEWRSL